MTKVTRLSILTGLSLFCAVWLVRAQDSMTIEDRDISVVHFEELRYPPLARTANVEGVVVIRVSLDDKGNVERVEAISGNKVLVNDCLANAKKWKFEPNSKKSAVLIFDFTLKYASCGSASSFFVLRGRNMVQIMACAETIEPTRSK
jgi:TonB family protein